MEADGDTHADSLHDDGALATVTVPDYPNFYCLFGPNTGLAHGGSLMFMAECQVRYLTDCLREMVEKNIGAVNVRQDVHDDWWARVDAEHADGVDPPRNEQLVSKCPGAGFLTRAMAAGGLLADDPASRPVQLPRGPASHR